MCKNKASKSLFQENDYSECIDLLYLLNAKRFIVKMSGRVKSNANRVITVCTRRTILVML